LGIRSGAEAGVGSGIGFGDGSRFFSDQFEEIVRP
jgi:hypothetical protein